jgi:5-methylcytosine-specific restriction endonuclease McrA
MPIWKDKIKYAEFLERQRQRGKLRIGEKNPFYGKKHTNLKTKGTHLIHSGSFKKGHIVLPEWKEKIILANLGKKPSEKQLECLKLGQKNRKGCKLSPEHREKLRQAHLGKKLSEEHKNKLREGQKGDKGSNWKGGISFELYGLEWTKLLKHSIRTRDCFTCKICGKNGWIVHHIDYNKKNNNPDNLVTLCGSCHSKTNYKREYWKQYFINLWTSQK